jgi:hypothetical protein
MSQRWRLSGLVALAAAAMVSASAVAQRDVGSLIGQANALRARIHSFHAGPGRWLGTTPPPPDYCRTMRAGEAVLKELAELSSKAILYRQPGVALSLQRAADGLSDELDQEEKINDQAEVKYDIYPCPLPGIYPARAIFLRAVELRMPHCRLKADALRLSFAARRNLMEQCLRVRD